MQISWNSESGWVNFDIRLFFSNFLRSVRWTILQRTCLNSVFNETLVLSVFTGPITHFIRRYFRKLVKLSSLYLFEFLWNLKGVFCILPLLNYERSAVSCSGIVKCIFLYMLICHRIFIVFHCKLQNNVSPVKWQIFLKIC